MTIPKKSNTTALQAAFSFGRTINQTATKYSASIGNAVGTAVILDFLSKTALLDLPFGLARVQINEGVL